MDTKVLYVVAVIVAAISGGYYYYSGKAKKLEVDSAKNMTYSAQGVHLTQTDEQGNLYIRAEIKQLQQDMQQKTSQLDQLNAVMYKQGKPDVTFFARQVNGYDDNSRVHLGFHFGHIKLYTHIHHGDDVAAKVHNTFDKWRGFGNRGRFHHSNNLFDIKDIDPINFIL